METKAKEYADGAVIRIGEEIYQRELRATLDTPENKGRLVALDIRSSEYEMGRDSAEAIFGMLARRPDAMIYLLRVGRPTTISFGG